MSALKLKVSFRLLETLTDLVQAEKGTGDPVPQSDFHEAAPDVRVFSLLLYGHIAAELGEPGEDEIPAEKSWLKNKANAESANIDRWNEDFLSKEGEQFVIPSHSVEAALDLIDELQVESYYLLIRGTPGRSPDASSREASVPFPVKTSRAATSSVFNPSDSCR